GSVLPAEPGRLPGALRAGVARAAPRVGLLRPAAAAPPGTTGAQRGAGVLAEPAGPRPAAGPAAPPGRARRQGLAALAGGQPGPVPVRPAARAGGGICAGPPPAALARVGPGRRRRPLGGGAFLLGMRFGSGRYTDTAGSVRRSPRRRCTPL